MQLYEICGEVSVGLRLELLSVSDHIIVGPVPTSSKRIRALMTPV
jgi:hypothetical protein